MEDFDASPDREPVWDGSEGGWDRRHWILSERNVIVAQLHCLLGRFLNF
jgi:hypothetical protein